MKEASGRRKGKEGAVKEGAGKEEAVKQGGRKEEAGNREREKRKQ
ncbi:hypothetical protein [Cohnella cellulosilytica]